MLPGADEGHNPKPLDRAVLSICGAGVQRSAWCAPPQVAQSQACRRAEPASRLSVSLGRSPLNSRRRVARRRAHHSAPTDRRAPPWTQFSGPGLSACVLTLLDSFLCPYPTTLTAFSSHNLDMKHLAGADPELILLNSHYRELERIPLSDMSRKEINELVQKLGFYRKEKPDSPVPKEFQLAPARPPPDSFDHA
uniref:Selenoprotein M n=1 Tax=Podarcis muralis TaxID=64176 RepID=A0A670JHZ4_PODMU